MTETPYGQDDASPPRPVDTSAYIANEKSAQSAAASAVPASATADQYEAEPLKRSIDTVGEPSVVDTGTELDISIQARAEAHDVAPALDVVLPGADEASEDGGRSLNRLVDTSISPAAEWTGDGGLSPAAGLDVPAEPAPAGTREAAAAPIPGGAGAPSARETPGAASAAGPADDGGAAADSAAGGAEAGEATVGLGAAGASSPAGAARAGQPAGAAEVAGGGRSPLGPPGARREVDEAVEGGGELADPERLRAAVEAVLLVVDMPTSATDLAQVLGRPTAAVQEALHSLRAEYDAGLRGLDLREVAEGWRLYSREDFAPYVERFVLEGQQARLTQAALETLAVIAYRQPVTRSRIAAIRGVSVDAVMRTLLTRGLVEECGADPDTGGGLYRTTRLFLEKVGLRSLDELPSLAPLLPDTSQLDDVAVST